MKLSTKLGASFLTKLFQGKFRLLRHDKIRNQPVELAQHWRGEELLLQRVGGGGGGWRGGGGPGAGGPQGGALGVEGGPAHRAPQAHLVQVW